MADATCLNLDEYVIFARRWFVIFLYDIIFAILSINAAFIISAIFFGGRSYKMINQKGFKALLILGKGIW